MPVRTAEVLAGIVRSLAIEIEIVLLSRMIEEDHKADNEEDIHPIPETEIKMLNLEKIHLLNTRKRRSQNQKIIELPPKTQKIMSHQKLTLKSQKLKKTLLRKEKKKRREVE